VLIEIDQAVSILGIDQFLELVHGQVARVVDRTDARIEIVTLDAKTHELGSHWSLNTIKARRWMTSAGAGERACAGKRMTSMWSANSESGSWVI